MLQEVVFNTISARGFHRQALCAARPGCEIYVKSCCFDESWYQIKSIMYYCLIKFNLQQIISTSLNFKSS